MAVAQGSSVIATGAGATNNNNNNKRSIITQETDLQISTFQASQMEQRAIFDTSPKLREQPTRTISSTNGGPNNTTGREQMIAAGDTEVKLSLKQPAIVEAKKVEVTDASHLPQVDDYRQV